MPVSHGTDLKAGPTTLVGYLLGDFESSYPLSYQSRVHTPLCDFEAKNGISSPSFAYASPFEAGTSLDTSKDVPIIPAPFLPLAPLAELDEEMGLRLMLVLTISVHKIRYKVWVRDVFT